jgi:Xaa-Pro dipeptidase
MSFHMLSWLMGTGHGDAFVSDTVLLTDAGPVVLTRP